LGLNFAYKIGGKLYDATSKDVADDGYYWNEFMPLILQKIAGHLQIRMELTQWLPEEIWKM
jgi:hypothetical protein